MRAFEPKSLKQIRPVLEAVFAHYEVPREIRLEVGELLQKLPTQPFFECLSIEVAGPTGQGEHC